MEDSRKLQRRSLHAYALLGFVCVSAIAYLIVRPYYYNWILSGQTNDVVIYCSTAPLRGKPLKILAMYDQLALSPPARLLGKYQNRPPEKVRSYHMKPIEDYELTDFSLKLKSVPAGPLAKIFINAGGQSYYAEVTDRLPKNGVIYVRMD
ncbi:MAG: hypothetical protein QGG53_37990 [Planctomycetota bacterium]|jgi:hypothetical protein|nr:hypothetical protein [Planctomycetota bacterium]